MMHFDSTVVDSTWKIKRSAGMILATAVCMLLCTQVSSKPAISYRLPLVNAVEVEALGASSCYETSTSGIAMVITSKFLK
jgi:hypothetical protein